MVISTHGTSVDLVGKALKIQMEAQRRRALAPDYDPIRRGFELGLAERMDQEAQALLTPPKSLQSGLGPWIQQFAQNMGNVDEEPFIQLADGLIRGRRCLVKSARSGHLSP